MTPPPRTRWSGPDRALAAALAALGSAWLLAAGIRAVAVPPGPVAAFSRLPESSPELVAEGHRLFLLNCSECHGDDAHGEDGPDLYRLPISDARIASVVRHGIKGEMTAFAKSLDDRQIGAVIFYLRTLK